MGYGITLLPVDKQGVVALKSLEKHIKDTTRLVSIMFANNEIGTVQPIRELAEITHQHGCLFHTDAVQGVGHLPIDVRTLGIDMLSASAHKFNGPKGIGFLYIRGGLSIESFMHGGAQEKGNELELKMLQALLVWLKHYEIIRNTWSKKLNMSKD